MRPAYLLERVGAAALLAAMSPVMLAIALAIALMSRRSPLVRHTRVGWQGRPLRMLKFRTMWDPALPPGKFRLLEDVAGPVLVRKQDVDTRVKNPFAAFCRRYSLDELPQLCHVLRGEMSLVGPRPITREELDEHYSGCAQEVLSLRPGLTGLWQVMGRNDLTYATRRRLDLLLVRNASITLYVVVLLRSVPRVVSGKGAY